MEYPDSIKAYSKACDEILSWMEDDWINQDKFYELSIMNDPISKHLQPFSGDTVMLPMWGDKNLALLQLMIKYKIASFKEIDGILFYKKSSLKVKNHF